MEDIFSEEEKAEIQKISKESGIPLRQVLRDAVQAKGYSVEEKAQEPTKVTTPPAEEKTNAELHPVDPQQSAAPQPTQQPAPLPSAATEVPSKAPQGPSPEPMDRRVHSTPFSDKAVEAIKGMDQAHIDTYLREGGPQTQELLRQAGRAPTGAGQIAREVGGVAGSTIAGLSSMGSKVPGLNRVPGFSEADAARIQREVGTSPETLSAIKARSEQLPAVIRKPVEAMSGADLSNPFVQQEESKQGLPRYLANQAFGALMAPGEVVMPALEAAKVGMRKAGTKDIAGVQPGTIADMAETAASFGVPLLVMNPVLQALRGVSPAAAGIAGLGMTADMAASAGRRIGAMGSELIVPSANPFEWSRRPGATERGLDPSEYLSAAGEAAFAGMGSKNMRGEVADVLRGAAPVVEAARHPIEFARRVPGDAAQAALAVAGAADRALEGARGAKEKVGLFTQGMIEPVRERVAAAKAAELAQADAALAQASADRASAMASGDTQAVAAASRALAEAKYRRDNLAAGRESEVSTLGQAARAGGVGALRAAGKVTDALADLPEAAIDRVGQAGAAVARGAADVARKAIDLGVEAARGTSPEKIAAGMRSLADRLDPPRPVEEPPPPATPPEKPAPAPLARPVTAEAPRSESPMKVTVTKAPEARPVARPAPPRDEAVAQAEIDAIANEPLELPHEDTVDPSLTREKLGLKAGSFVSEDPELQRLFDEAEPATRAAAPTEEQQAAQKTVMENIAAEPARAPEPAKVEPPKVTTTPAPQEPRVAELQFPGEAKVKPGLSEPTRTAPEAPQKNPVDTLFEPQPKKAEPEGYVQPRMFGNKDGQESWKLMTKEEQAIVSEAGKHASEANRKRQDPDLKGDPERAASSKLYKNLAYLVKAKNRATIIHHVEKVKEALEAYKGLTEAPKKAPFVATADAEAESASKAAASLSEAEQKALKDLKFALELAERASREMALADKAKDEKRKKEQERVRDTNLLVAMNAVTDVTSEIGKKAANILLARAANYMPDGLAREFREQPKKAAPPRK